MTTKRERGVEYFVKALSTGERTAAQRLESYLAADVEYDTNTQPGATPIGREVFKGREAVLNQVFGLWPATPAYSRLGWSDPLPEDGGLKVTTSGAVTLTCEFTDTDEIRRVRLDGGYGSGASAAAPRSGTVEEIPLAVKALINNALANQTPVVVTYVDGGLPQAIVDNPWISLFYSDRRANATVNVSGRARISADDETRRKVFELAPEVEQTHDPQRHGVAVVIDVLRLQANTGTGRGNYVMVRT